MPYYDNILINTVGVIAGLYTGVILVNLGIIAAAFILHMIRN